MLAQDAFNRFTTAFLAPVMLVLLAFFAAPGTARADNTPNCGALGQKACPIGVKATYIDKAQTTCPKGSFFDVSTFQCWSCPSGSKRTVFPINDKKACEKPLKTEYAEADKDKKIKFSNDTIKKIKNGNFDKICKGDSFYDKAGGEYGACWDCPKGYKRGIESVKSKHACVKFTGLKHDPATKVSGFNPCRKGFFDPRNNGECWSCPGAYFRGPTKVNTNDACLIKPENVCDKGLALDFVSGKCVTENVALCLAAVRSLKGGKVAAQAVKQMTQEMPGFRKIFGDRQSEEKEGSSKLKNGNTKSGLVKKLWSEAEPYANEINEVAKLAASSAKDVNKYVKEFVSEKFCTMTDADRKNMIARLNLKPAKIFAKAGPFDGFDNPFIKSAHAANKHFYMSYAVSVAAAAGIGGSFEFALVTDYKDHIGGFFGIGPALQSNAAAGGSFNIGFYWDSKIQGFDGWGFGLSASGGPPALRFVSGGLDFFIPKGWHTLDGVGFNVGAGVGILPVDGTFSAAYGWRLDK